MALVISRKRAIPVKYDRYAQKRRAAAAKRRRYIGPMVYQQFPTRPNIIVAKGEVKYFDCGFDVAVTGAGTDWADTEVPMDNYINSSGAVAVYTDSCLLPSAQGNAYGQVQGAKYKLRQLRIKGQAIIATLQDQIDCPTPGKVRIILVMDKQPNGLQAQGEDIMQDMGAAGENLHSFTRMSTQASRFRILKDKTITLNVSATQQDSLTQATASVGFNLGRFKFSYKPKVPLDVHIKVGNSTPTVGAMIDHNIFMLAYATVGTTASAVTLTGCSRAYFFE